MRKILALVFCLVTLTVFSQTKTKTLHTFGNPKSFEITTTIVKCGTSTYQSLNLTNYTNEIMTIEFDVESYWSNDPKTPTKGDEVHKYTIKPNETVNGDCNNKHLLQWMRGDMTKTTLVNLQITNIKFSQ